MDSVTKPGSNKRSQILGGTLGTLAGLIVVGLIFFFVRRRRRARRTEEEPEEEFDKPLQSPSVVVHSPTNRTVIAPLSTGDSKAQLLMTYGGGSPTAVSPQSESGSHPGEGSSRSDSSQQPRLVPQRAGHLHVTNLVPGEDKPLPSPMTAKPLPEVGQSQDQNLRREVEQLRMEMEAIRTEQQLNQPPQAVTEEPPPRYAES
jgi:hypothetical protein